MCECQHCEGDSDCDPHRLLATFCGCRVSKTYRIRDGGVEAVTDITFDAKKGELFTIIGPSGCGKSTVLSMIAGLSTQSAGTITVEGNIVVGSCLST